jgi:hypothetical protein
VLVQPIGIDTVENRTQYTYGQAIQHPKLRARQLPTRGARSHDEQHVPSGARKRIRVDPGAKWCCVNDQHLEATSELGDALEQLR